MDTRRGSAEVAVSRRSLLQVEAGDANPSLTTLLRRACGFGIPYAQVVETEPLPAFVTQGDEGTEPWRTRRGRPGEPSGRLPRPRAVEVDDRPRGPSRVGRTRPRRGASRHGRWTHRRRRGNRGVYPDRTISAVDGDAPHESATTARLLPSSSSPYTNMTTRSPTPSTSSPTSTRSCPGSPAG
jgi:DNA-binding XRE family transcriptional regulator